VGLYLGIELGSTRIKAVLIDETFAPVASGAHTWENRFEDGIWTYRLEDAWAGIQDAFAKLADDYGRPLTELDGMGVSAMMHGYLPFDGSGRQLAPFRTWRNTSTGHASERLTKEFNFTIPQRWSIAHLYQAVLNKEPHVGEIAFLTTLAGYVHWKLTGRKALGMNEASGMMPFGGRTYDPAMVRRFEELTGIQLTGILPEIIDAGGCAGTLTAEGARLLDPTGALLPGIPFCPPEGDAGTGMVATNSVKARTGNVSAGTSIFANIVLDRPLSALYPEIDVMVSPTGRPIACVHCNNCASDLDAWIGLLAETLDLMGAEFEQSDLYNNLFLKALEGDPDGGGLFNCNYVSGEHMTGFEEGRPLFARLPDSRFTLANFMRTHLFSAMATLKTGMDLLTGREGVKPEILIGHGGLFKTEKVAQTLMAGALGVPVAVMETAGEGGAWGIALLAAYRGLKREGETLESFLDGRVFAKSDKMGIKPNPRDTEGFQVFIKRYRAGLAAERAAVENL
jgi:sugar (pentulose or hexulose) kinase